MKTIKVRKNPKDMNDIQFLKYAIHEIQTELKGQGKQLQFDIEARETMVRAKKTKTSDALG